MGIVSGGRNVIYFGNYCGFKIHKGENFEITRRKFSLPRKTHCGISNEVLGNVNVSAIKCVEVNNFSRVLGLLA
jgi:hypothetical protein